MTNAPMSHHTLAALLAAETPMSAGTRGVTCRILGAPRAITVNAEFVTNDNVPNTELLFAQVDSELELASDNAFSALVCTIADFGA